MINLANRDDGLGLVTNIVLAVSLAALGNAIIYSQGWGSVGNVIQPSFAPPGYVVGIVWLFLFAFMGTARWLLIKSKSQKATYHSRSVIFLVVFCFLYPFYSLALDSNIGGLIGNIATILLAGWTCYSPQQEQLKHSSLRLVAG